jgi:transposase
VLEKRSGPDFAGSLNCDYCSAHCSFAGNFWIKAQYCGAHVIRDMRFLGTHPDPLTTLWAEQLRERARRLFAAWHRRDELSALGVARSLRSVARAAIPMATTNQATP